MGAAIINYNPGSIDLVLNGYVEKTLHPVLLDFCQVVISIHKKIQMEELAKKGTQNNSGTSNMITHYHGSSVNAIRHRFNR